MRCCRRRLPASVGGSPRGASSPPSLCGDEIARAEGADPLDRAAYRRRNAVERLVGRLKEARSVATRSDELAESHLGIVQLALVRLLLNNVAPSNTA